MACRWHTDQKTGERWHVPECWGTVHNPDGPCHCDDRKRDEDDTDDDRVTALEQRVAELEARLQKL